MRNAVWTFVMTLAACAAFRGYPPQAAEVEIAWTAPGDDGNVGTASEYDIRYSADSATLVAWTSAIQIGNEPIPLIAGTTQRDTLTLGAGVWFVAIKARDEAYNWSGMSNIIRVTIDGVMPAAIVDLRYRILP